MMTLADLEQGSDEWLRARLGRVTASRVCDVIAKTKSGWGASRANYAAQLIAERLTGEPLPSFTNAAMQHGTATEPEARQAYSFRQDVDVAQVGFVEHPTIPMSGCSPDGLIGSEGLVEIKCPSSATHIDTLLRQKVPEKYLVQIAWQLACYPERRWADYASYDPRLPESMRLFVKRVDRDDELIAQLEKDVSEFLNEVASTVASLRHLYEPQMEIAA